MQGGGYLFPAYLKISPRLPGYVRGLRDLKAVGELREEGGVANLDLCSELGRGGHGGERGGEWEEDRGLLGDFRVRQLVKGEEGEDHEAQGEAEQEQNEAQKGQRAPEGTHLDGRF